MKRGDALGSGLALRFVAMFLRGLGGGREEGDAQHAQDVLMTPT